jgi:hypothetical protein
VELRHITKLATTCFFTILAFILLYSSVVQVASAQSNSTTIKVPVSNVTGLPESGLQLMLLTKNGGITSSNEIFSYNIVANELAFADLRSNLVEKKVLNNFEIENLTNTFYTTEIFRDDIFDRNVCPDCTQYGLSYFFIDLETHIPFKGGAFWTENTTGAQGFMKFAEFIENISPK